MIEVLGSLCVSCLGVCTPELNSVGCSCAWQVFYVRLLLTQDVYFNDSSFVILYGIPDLCDCVFFLVFMFYIYILYSFYDI